MQFLVYDENYVNTFYRYAEPDTGRRYRLGDLTAPGGEAKGNPYYEFLGVTRYWRYSKQRMQKLYEQGRVVQTKPGAVPQYKRYLDEMPGVSLQDIWDDIKPIGAQAKDRLGYPTQKPVALLERIISYSSNKGDIVLDPFCGCGTALVAAHKLNRRWIGIDITHLAIAVMRKRLTTASQAFDLRSLASQRTWPALMPWPKQDRYPIPVVGAQPGGRSATGERKKGADKGIDGVIHFIDDPARRQNGR